MYFLIENNFIFEQNMRNYLNSILSLSLILFGLASTIAQSGVQLNYGKTSKNTSQYSTIRGTIYEKETGEPSFGTNVKIKGTGIGASTDLNGYYQINKLLEGEIILEVTNIEFKTIELAIVLKKGKITTKNFFLEINDEILNEFEYCVSSSS